MAAPGRGPIAVQIEEMAGYGLGSTQGLLSALLRAGEQVSDLIFSPGRPPQVGMFGQLIPVQGGSISLLTPDDTRRIAADVIGENKQAINILREQGSCDVSFGVPGVARFRANIFIQRGSCAVVMRVIPTTIPTLAELGLPGQLAAVADLPGGIVLVSGGRASGKSSTLAALLDRINQQRVCHIITVEDPIEFLHNHKKATVHQRELHSDTASFAQGLRAALRQAPQVILVSEIRDGETMDALLEAAETGHLVLSSMNTVDAVKTVERVLSLFPGPEQASARLRMARAFRMIIAQRLVQRADGSGQIAAVEILRFNSEVRACLEGENSLQCIAEILHRSSSDIMQSFDVELEKLIRSGVVELEAGLAYASHPSELRRRVSV